MDKTNINKITYRINPGKLSITNQHLFAERLKNEIELMFPDLAVVVVSKNKFSRQSLLELECSLPNYCYQIELDHVNNQIHLLALDLEERLIEQISAARISAA